MYVETDKYGFEMVYERLQGYFNNDGHMDYLYTGTMKPDNVEVTGEDTGGLCGGESS